MANTPAPIFNHRKRPRQSLIADPPHNLISHPVPGPSGAASSTYNDLMPPGGFGNTKVQQRNMTPNSGQGAAFFSRHSYGNNNQGNQPTGQTNYVGPTNRKQSFSRNNSFNNNRPGQGAQQNQKFNPSQTGQTSQGRGQWGKQSTSSYQPSNQYQSHSNKGGNQRNMAQNSGRGTNNQSGYRGQPPAPWNNNRIGQNNQNNINQQRMMSSNQPGNVNRNNIQYGQAGNGMTTKMVATSCSGHIDNRYDSKGNCRNFNNQSSNPGTSSQYRFKSSQTGMTSDGVEMGEWDTSFDENFGGQTSNIQKQTKMVAVKSKQNQQDTGLHMLTVNVAGMKRWSRFKESIIMLFEMIGVLDSAITKSSVDGKEFLMRDEEKNSVKCVFFEIDRQIPKMTRGMVYRVVGTYDRTKDLMKCSSVRSTSEGERNLGSKLVEICTKTMIEKTRHLREM